MSEKILAEILVEASKAILEKVKRGKKLSVEEIMLLYLDITHREIRGLRREISEGFKEVNKRIDSINSELSKRISEMDKRLTARIDETNKGIDRIYELLVKRTNYQTKHKNNIKKLQYEEDQHKQPENE